MLLCDPPAHPEVLASRLVCAGTPEDPDGLRSAMRADFSMMKQIRQEKPEWARVITGNADGSYDKAGFLKFIRDNYRASRMQEDLKINDDGTAAVRDLCAAEPRTGTHTRAHHLGSAF